MGISDRFRKKKPDEKSAEMEQEISQRERKNNGNKKCVSAQTLLG